MKASSSKRLVGFFLTLVAGLTIGLFIADPSSLPPLTPVSATYAQQAGDTATVESARTHQKEPTGTLSDPYMYYAGTEALAPDEIRIVACGTGMPAARRGAAAACFLIELGNGDKFLFDIGTGSMRNVMALNIPADFLTKVFLSHLHTDHWGDLDALWAGGWTGGRTRPLEVWGPSGSREDMGTKWAVDHFLKANHWDYVTRAVKVNSVPGKITVHEFDFRQVNGEVYNENGVVIRSIPAIHAGDGPVSYILEWNGYKIVYAGDTAPNNWFMEHCQDADLIINECMHTPEQLMQNYGQPAQRAMMMQVDIHTSAFAFGKIASELRPGLAVAYHFFNEEGTRYGIYEAIRRTYDGPLSMADDLMVWNITKDGVRERMTIPVDNAWDVAGPTAPPAPDNKFPKQESDWILGNRWQPAIEMENELFRPFREKHNLPQPE